MPQLAGFFACYRSLSCLDLPRLTEGPAGNPASRQAPALPIAVRALSHLTMAAIVRWRLVNRSSISSDSPRVDGIARATANSLRFVTNLSRAAIRVFACSLSSVIS